MGVFVSYSSRDKEAVTRLTQDLQDADEQVWLDQRLAGGDAWWRAILEQIRDCDVFIFALSQNSIQSKPCQAELHYAQDLGLPILPVQVGPVDSMQLNPLATVQTVDYRTSTSTVGMRLLTALNRARAQRQPLPSELPPEPQVPFEYLIRLYTTISSTDYLSPPDQAALVAQLQFGLREDGDHDAARNDIVMLLTKLRDREDVTYRTRTDVEAILANIEAEARVESASQPPSPTAASTHPVSPGSTTTLVAAPTSSEDTATTDTTEPRIEIRPPNTRVAAEMTVPVSRSQPQTEATDVREEPHSPSGRRSTKNLLVGMAVTAVILVVIAVALLSVGVQQESDCGWCAYGTSSMHIWSIAGEIVIGIALTLIIAILVMLNRRKAASDTQQLDWRSTTILIGMVVTAVILIGATVQLVRMGDQHETLYSNGRRFYIDGSICFGIAAALTLATAIVVVVKLVVMPRQVGQPRDGRDLANR